MPLPQNEKSNCGFPKSEGFIVNGRNAKQGSYPFIAAMGVNFPGAPDNIGFVCGGSLINRRYVLTAAHCHSNDRPIIAVRLGEHDFAQDPDCDEKNCKSSKILSCDFLIDFGRHLLWTHWGRGTNQEWTYNENIQ